MEWTESNHKKIAIAGLFGAISVVLGVMENYFPLPIPGVRLGLANLPVMVVLYIEGVIPAASVMTLKITLVPLLSGNLLFRLLLSFPAGVMAFLGMLVCVLFFRRYISLIGTGVVGASLHMITQLFVIDRLYINGFLSATVVGCFMIAALLTGILTGGLASVLIGRLKKMRGSALRNNASLKW